jgi:hypothetical protein
MLMITQVLLDAELRKFSNCFEPSGPGLPGLGTHLGYTGESLRAVSVDNSTDSRTLTSLGSTNSVSHSLRAARGFLTAASTEAKDGFEKVAASHISLSKERVIPGSG